MVVTNSEELYKRLILFRSHGITRDETMMTEQQGDWYYQQLELGYNYRITDISCALGLSQMDKLVGFLERRRQIAKRYNEAFCDVSQIKIPMQLADCESGWHLYVIQVKADYRKEIFDNLRKSGIGVNVHYIPVYKHPYYQRNGYADVCCKNGEVFYERAISLPIFPLLTDVQQDYVIEQVLKIVKENIL